jgi:hypothetical protein
MNNNYYHLWMATSDLADWFSRLGGSALYPGFVQSDIYLSIGYTFLQNHPIPQVNPIDLERFVDERFNTATRPVLPKVAERIRSMTIADASAARALINEYVDYANQKMAGNQEAGSCRWSEFVAMIKDLNG